ncbi:MAG: Neocarzinostatin family [Ilumatobacteraceae bacterium]|nr:Neocarzinostatin family [Ilumatobacteraceae bacterium]
MGKAVGGASAVGCGAVGLVGLLIGVGLTLWLGSMALTGSTGGDPRPATTLAGPTTSTAPPSTLDDRSDAGLPPEATVVVLAGNDFDDGGRITVRGSGFPVGPIAVTMCLADTPLAADARCDATTRVPIATGPDGGWTLVYPAPRVITVARVAYDCAAVPGGCAVLAQLDSRTDDVGVSARVTFATGLPPVDAMAPPTG